MTSFRMNSDFKLPTGRRELKIGDSLRNNGTSFHGIKYDFKPSNEDCSESAIMDVTPTNQVSLKYPRSDSEGSSDFMYSGTMKQFPKEYFLVIDHVTGEVTLEKLTANIQLKRTKVANTANKNKNQNYKKIEIEKDCRASPELNDNPSTSKKKTKRKQKTKNSTVPDQQLLKKYNLIPQHSPLHPSPSRTSPESKNPTCNNDYKLPSYRTSTETCASQSNLNTVDDDESSMTGFESKFPTLPELLPQHENEFGLRVDQDNTIDSNSDSSSDSSSDSDSNSDSSSSSTISVKKEEQTHINGYLNGCNAAVKGQLLLKDDLRLSDSGSDSD